MRPWQVHSPRWLYPILILVFLGAGSLPGHALPPPIPAADSTQAVAPQPGQELTFFYPAGRIYELETLFPLGFEYHNTSPVPRTYVTDWSGPSPSLAIPAEMRELVLQPGEKRRFTLTFPAQELNRLYSIEVNGKTYNHELTSSPRNLVTGIVSPREYGFDYLRALKLEVAQNYNAQPEDKLEYAPLSSVSRLEVSALPETWAALKSLDVLVVYDLPALSLSQNQQRALVQWAQQGGSLVLVSNGVPGEYAGTALQEFLPIRPQDVSTANGVLQLTGPKAEDAAVLVELKETPLLVEREVAQGRILLVTAPFTELGAPLDEAMAQALWRAVYDPLPDNQRTYQNRNRIARDNLNDIPEHPRAQAGLLAAFLLLYALIVGPVNLGILRKKDKMLWSFVTVPVIAVLFAGGAYLTNVLRRSHVPVYRELGLLEVRADQATGVAESEATLYSPSARSYVVASEPAASFFYHGYRHDGFGLYRSTPEGGLAAAVPLKTWDILPFQSDAVLDLERPLKASTIYAASGVDLTVDTPLSSVPGGAIFYNPSRGISETFTLERGGSTHTLSLKPAQSYKRFDALVPTENREKPGREELLQNLSNSNRVNVGAGYLLFWCDQVRTPLTVDHNTKQVSDYLVVVRISDLLPSKVEADETAVEVQP